MIYWTENQDLLGRAEESAYIIKFYNSVWLNVSSEPKQVLSFRMSM